MYSNFIKYHNLSPLIYQFNKFIYEFYSKYNQNYYYFNHYY